MAPQLQINQGPQDALLFDNTRSYFTNVGYVRTSNFQMELRDVDSQNTPNLGATVNFVIPKAADLLGPVDLMIEFAKVTDPSFSANSGKFWGWVESIGYAMIDKIVFSIGSHDVETITGDQLNIMNELMRSDTHRYGFNQIGKTGRPLVQSEFGYGGTAGSSASYFDSSKDSATYDRLIVAENTVKEGKKLIIPLGLFFTMHPSKYFPLAAIAGCNDVRISIKFKTVQELVMCHGMYSNTQKTDDTLATYDADDALKIARRVAATDAELSKLSFEGGSAFSTTKGCYLRCHYIHVTGPEATTLMNKEHVRLMKLWTGNQVTKIQTLSCSTAGTASTIDIDLSFLHPVQELVITIRKVSDMSSAVANEFALYDANDTGKPKDTKAMTKNYFAYHGGGYDPNQDSWPNCTEQKGTSDAPEPTYLKTTTFQLKLNGQSRHLDGAGIDRDYLMNRLMPMLHSNTACEWKQLADSSMSVGMSGVAHTTHPAMNADWRALEQLKGRKEIYVYPFALNPEGANPSGSVNFSKVSHAKLSIGVEGYAPSGSTTDEYQVDVYGVYYNWLAIKDGRALTSFA